MTSVQAELSSARLLDEPHTPSATQDTNVSDVATSAWFEEISVRVGGRFSADLAAILQTPPNPSGSRQIAPSLNNASDTHAYRRFALDCLRAGKVQIAVSIIHRYAPGQIVWLDKQIKTFQTHIQIYSAPQTSPRASEFIWKLAIVPDHVKIDAEAGRIAYVLGEFAVFRAWAYGMAADDGDGWVERKEMETLWRNVDIANSSRHARRLIQHGITQGYWSQDKTRKRIYLTGQVKMAAQLIGVVE